MPLRLTTAICLAAGMVLLGCGSVDAGELEDKIQSELEDGNVQVQSVECPDDIERSDGTSFECTVTTEDRGEVPFRGEITNDGDSFEGRLEEQPAGGDEPPAQGEQPAGQTLNAQQVEQQISSDLERQRRVAPRSVDCPDDIAAVEGTDFRCTVTAPNGEVIGFTGQVTAGGRGFRGQVDTQPNE